MPTERDLLTILNRLYDSVQAQSDWPQILDLVHETFDARGSQLLFMPDQTGRHLTNEVSTTIGQNLCDEYARDYFSIDPRILRVPSYFGSAKRCIELYPADAFEKTAVASFLDRSDVQARWATIAPFSIGGDSFGFFAVIRQRHKGPFTEADARDFQHLVPHVQRVLELQARMGELASRAQTSEAALDRIGSGVVFADSEARILFANAKAQLLLNGQDGVLSSSQRLTCRLGDETATLRQVIRTISDGRVTGGSGPNILFASRRSGKQALVLVVLPVPREHAAAKLTRGASVAVFILDPSERRLTPAVVLKKLGFTPAEARLAAELVKGDRLEAIAERLGVAKGTVRSQLLQLFRKSGTSRQTELVVFLNRCFTVDLKLGD